MKLVLPKAIENKIHAYAMSASGEIAGMGKVRINDAGDIIVEEVMIYEQEATTATADLSPKAIAKWQSELVKAGGSPKNWRLWWHSHASMAVFFSTTDTGTINGTVEGDWLISLVVNKARERKARLDTYKPFRLTCDDVEVEVEGESFEIPPEIAQEVAEKVRYPKPTMGYHENKRNDAIIRSRQDTIDLHRHCPMHTTHGKQRECYHPYGDIKNAVYANCTTKAFRKMYGKNPFKEEVHEDSDYDKAGTMQIINALDADIRRLENEGKGNTQECLELKSEMADWYYSLADMEANENIAENIRAEAQLIENELPDDYQYQPTLV